MRTPKHTLTALSIITALLTAVGCSTVPQSIKDQAKAECAHITSSWERARCGGDYKRNWTREQEIEIATKDCKRYWPEGRSQEIAKCVDGKVNRTSKSNSAANSAAAVAICSALTGGDTSSCAAGVAENISGKSSDKVSDRVRDLEQELKRRSEKFSRDCLLSGGSPVGDTCLNTGSNSRRY
jgi:hypothetical protein